MKGLTEMGGYGSGYRGKKKTAVEDCLVLSMASLRNSGPLTSPVWRTGTCVWDDSLSVNFELKISSAETGAIWLSYLLV